MSAKKLWKLLIEELENPAHSVVFADTSKAA